MAFFGGGMDPNMGRDLAHARDIERRGRQEQHRRDPNQARLFAETSRLKGGGRVLWGRLLTNVVGVGVAVFALLLVFALFRG